MSSASSQPILIAADHAGFAMKAVIETELASLGYTVEDLGTNSDASVDYSDYAHALAARVSSGEAQRGILLCGTGLGMSYAANRHAHVRAAVVWSPEVAVLAREHNDANVLVLPARCLSDTDGKAIVRAFLDTEFAGGRHVRRVEKIELDTQHSPEDTR